MSDWGSDYNGKLSKKRPKQVVKDKHGREIPLNGLDKPMKLFWDNCDKEALALFLSHDEKYETFMAALMDPSQAHISYPVLCKRYGVTLHELNGLYMDGMRHLGMMNAAGRVPKIMDNVFENAENRLTNCPRCDGLKEITKNEYDQDGKLINSTSRTCPQCEGVGKITAMGDKHAQDLVFESMKLTNQKGPAVQIQQNFGDSTLLDGKMESMLKLTQSITVGAREVKENEPA